MDTAFDVEWTYEDDEGEMVYVTATGSISTYYPATMYRSNGDPGDPAEGGEVEIGKITCVDEEGNPVDFDESQYDSLEEYIVKTVDAYSH